jgi:hypothetical protein
MGILPPGSRPLGRVKPENNDYRLNVSLGLKF